LSLPEITELVEHVLGGPVHSLSARRLWQYTQGNVLYLRHLLEGEVSAGRIAEHSGVWLWDGRPTLPPSLAELLEARIARVPAPVRDVLEALAVTEPLDSDVLANVAGPDALVQAESLGFVHMDSGVHPAAVRLAHPMFAEVRRTGSLPPRQLRGRIATVMAHKPATDPRDLVRRAALTIESDLAPDANLLVAAAWAAMQLLDVKLAENLAERAVAAGGGRQAMIAHAMAITWQERGAAAEAVLAELADQTSGPARAQIALLRAINFAVVLGQVASAERELDEAVPADDEPAQAVATAVRAVIDVVRGHAQAAVDRARSVLALPPANAMAKMVATWALVSALGDLGRIDEIEPAANTGYRLADSSPEVSHLRLTLASLEAYAYRLAGALSAADTTIARIWSDTLDVPFEQSFHSSLAGMSAMSRGNLTDARRLLQELLAYLGAGDGGSFINAWGRSWLTTVYGMSGRAADARREFATIERSGRDPDAHVWDSEELLAEAWACAAEGATSRAIAITRDAATKECLLDRPAREVCLLQTATQFGDRTTAGRLAELAERVQGPRAPAAAAHAAALAAGSGDALADASRMYEAFGDRIAAADAAAQAVVAYRNAGRQGAAMSAWGTARRLTEECEGAQTPALRAITVPVAITARQSEIISLAAQGLSNQEIAERLSMSVRSVQGHLFRASQRVGVNSRDELIAILQAPMQPAEVGSRRR
jgi:DNA-binding CsgD family transcriptional regulator